MVLKNGIKEEFLNVYMRSEIQTDFYSIFYRIL